MFKIGDKVKLVNEEYDDMEDDPIWGGEHGFIIGEVINDRGDDDVQPITVDWGDTMNTYKESDLKLFTEPKEFIKKVYNII